MMKQPALLTLSVAALALASCGKQESASKNDVTPAYQKALAETKNEKGEPFFRIKTTADLPADLKWEDGSEQEEYGSPNAKKGGTYRFFIPDYPRTLRHIGDDASGGIRGYLLDDVFLPLVNRHPTTLKPIPACANQWAYGADKKTFYFKLDPDARFSDGEKVHADNFFFMFFFMQSNYHKDLWYSERYKKDFDNITKYDDLTLSITITDAKPDGIDNAGSLRPLPIAFHKEVGDDYLQLYNWRFIPTTGAYEVKESGMRRGQSITLTRVQDWWAQEKKFYRRLYNPDRVVLEVIRDPSKAIEVFGTGELDCYPFNLPERWYKNFPDNHPMVEKGYLHKVTFYNQVPRPTYGLWINSHKPLLNNRDIREGLHFACNWDLVIQQVFYGDYERLNMAEEGFGEFTDPSIKARPFDPAKAAELFAKAGFTERGTDGIFKNAQGQRLAFTITNIYKPLESSLVVIKEEARKAGVEFNIETPEQTAAWKKARDKQHDIAFAAFNVSVEMYPRFWEDWHGINAYDKDGKVKTDTNNFVMLDDKELNAWIDQYDKSEDVVEMKDLAWKMERRVHEHAVFVPAFKSPWYRIGYWRWVKWPDEHDVRIARDFEESWVFWIDEDERKATREAMKSGKTFPKFVKAYEQWRQK